MCCGEQRRRKNESLTAAWPILGASTGGSPLRTQQICGATRRGSPKGPGLNVAIERPHDGVTKVASGLNDPDFLGSNCPKKVMPITAADLSTPSKHWLSRSPRRMIHDVPTDNHTKTRCLVKVVGDNQSATHTNTPPASDLGPGGLVLFRV
jgi:hypothetical protein